MRRRRTFWAALTALLVLGSAILGFVSNLGGARNAVCSLAAIHARCVEWGLITPRPTEMVQQTRQRLLAGMNGRWGRQDRNCADTVDYSVTPGTDGSERITVRAPGYQSVGQVIAVENGVIISRSTTASETGPREQWEFRPNGDQMVVVDKDGVSTTLVRCES
jgi:hypothetical protein